ncbi:MAG: heavy metal translocating P-type ATPase [Clostridiales bacterium]|nr:heavy metal translocating P-type ATPase [Clostridiales bacterium]
MSKKQKKVLVRIIAAAVLLAAAKILALPVWLSAALYLVSYAVIGYDILKKAFKGIMNRQVFDENFLMAVATVGAIGLGIYEKSGDFSEAVSVMLFYQIGELFQSYAVGKSRRNISALMDIRPDYANIEEDGKLRQVDPDEVPAGSVIVVQPGEKVPIDGEVLEGESTLNTSALTGESQPVDVKAGEAVISGCINMTGVLKIRTTKEFGESTVAKILELVENSSSHKSRSENFISRFAKVYTPAVCYSALALAILPPLYRLIFMGASAEWNVWLYRALTFLVISCPCALVISIPLSFFAGLGGASKEGVLVKGSNYLEALSETKVVVFDKTGTLTRGVFEVSGVHHNVMEQKKLLEYAALAECASSHPISKSLQRAYGGEIDRTRVTDIQEISGCGIMAKVDGTDVAAGNGKLMDKLGVTHHDCHSVGTIIHIAINGEYAGHVVISDVEKEDSAAAIAALKDAGVEKTVMLTGDIRKVADYVAGRLGIDEVHSELLPGDKVAQVERLLNEKGRKGKLAFVGDGINDAPVLSRADIGIAMGAMGSDAAIEAADVVLMDDDPMKIAKAIKISRKCIGIVHQNIIFALGVKAVCLALGAAGVANMWTAIFADVGVMVLAVLNAIRALYVHNL